MLVDVMVERLVVEKAREWVAVSVVLMVDEKAGTLVDEKAASMVVASVWSLVVVWVVSKAAQWGGLLVVDSVAWSESWLAGRTVA